MVCTAPKRKEPLPGQGRYRALLAFVAFLFALGPPRLAEARVGLAEWRIELPGGLVVCHGDEAPDACGSVCIYDPKTQDVTVADVDDYKIYEGVVVGTTTHGWTWLVSYAVCHVLVLRFTVGEYILHFNPFWRGGF